MSDLMDFDYYDEESGPSDILAINSADLSNSIRFTLKGEDGKTPLPDNPQFEAFWKNKAAFDTSDTNAHGVLVYDETESATYPDGRVQWAFKDETTASKIQWKTLEDKFGKGEMEEPFGRAVGWLRSQTMWYLLRKVTAPPQQGEADRESFSVSRVCYAESGSKTVTSDLDWSFVNWKEPGKVVDIAVDWYKAFYKIYDGYPGGVFDMNMYHTFEQDRISKYVWRTFEAVTQTPLRDNGFFSTLATWTNTYTDFDVLLGYTGLYDFSQVWKNLIRGKFDMEKTFIKPLQARGWRMRNNPYTENLERQTPRVVPTNMKEDDRVLIMAVYAGLQNLRAKAIRFDVNSDANAAGGDPVIALYNLLNRHKKAVEKAFLQETIINTISCRAARTFHIDVEQEIVNEVRDCKARWDNAIKGVEDYIKTKVATVKDPLSVTLNADVAYNNPIKQFIGDLPT
eukprot:85622_1